MMTFKTADFETDLKTMIDVCGKWWKDSLFFKSYAIEYNVNVELFRSLFLSGVFIYSIGYQDDKAISVYAGVKTPYMFNSSIMVLTEVVWCVDKDYRSYKNVLELLKQVDLLAEQNEIDIYSLAVSNTEQFEPLKRLLPRRGYILMDNMFIKRRSR